MAKKKMIDRVQTPFGTKGPKVKRPNPTTRTPMRGRIQSPCMDKGS